MGYEVHYAANYNTPSYGDNNHRLDGTGIICHQIDFVRSPFNLKNITIYRQLCTLMQKEHFHLVHCHTPMGGVLARLAAHATEIAPVVYTAHGFHFFKGAPLINWLCYYPIEKFLSRYTDQQICINQEDYNLAKKCFHAKCIDYIPGAGINLEKLPCMTTTDILEKKRILGIPLDKYILLSSGEFIKRKNHETAIRAIADLKKNVPNIHYVICGHGTLHDYLYNLVLELGLENDVTFPGYREDMLEIYPCADIFIFPSFQEGLPMALLEAMASGVAVVCSDIRGSRDLMENAIDETDYSGICKGGILIRDATNVTAFSMALAQLLNNPSQLAYMGHANALRANYFSSARVSQSMESIYQRLFSEK